MLTSQKMLNQLGINKTEKEDIFRYYNKFKQMDEAEEKKDKVAVDKIWNETIGMMKKDIQGYQPKN